MAEGGAFSGAGCEPGEGAVWSVGDAGDLTERVVEWFSIAGSWRQAVVQLQVTGSSRHLLCHVLADRYYGQVPGNRLLRRAEALGAEVVDALVALGWVPPEASTMHWFRTWPASARRRAVAQVISESMAELTTPHDTVIASMVPCGLAACSGHAPRGGPVFPRPPAYRR